jgi:hypothetical protein
MRAGEEHVDAVALALGQFDGQKRAAAAEHVLTCGHCRREFDEVNSIVGELLPAVPAVQPKLGFDVEVLQRLGIGTASQRRGRRWWVLGVAAAAVIVVGLAIGGWLLARSAGGSSDAARLQLADGAPVGTVAVEDVAGQRVMVVAIVDAPADVSYTCRIRLTDGRVVESPAWEPGGGAWVVPLPGDAQVTDVDLVVSGTDNVWSTATF